MCTQFLTLAMLGQSLCMEKKKTTTSAQTPGFAEVRTISYGPGGKVCRPMHIAKSLN